MKPIFLHGMWRSGSTYVWSRFRAAKGTYCYYEPLNHGLGRLTRERIGRDTPEITAANAHPALSRPYFAEYEPLLKARGVRHFDPRFSYNGFALDERNTHAPLHRYIASLNDHAFNTGRIPVLGFNSTDLRISWLHRQFDSLDIHINRDPLDVWRSYMKFVKDGNYTFFTAWFNIIEKNADHPVLAPLAERLTLRRGLQTLTVKPKTFYKTTLSRMRPEDSYAMVFWLWLASTLHALNHCEYFIDMDRAGEKSYPQILAETICQASGLNITFDDMRPPPSPQRPEFGHETIEKNVLKSFPVTLFRPEHTQKNLAQLSGRKQEMVGTTGIEPVTPRV